MASPRCSHATVFLDTMVFLHCVPVQDIDLCRLLGVEKVEVVIPRITVQELDKHKNTHPSEKIRKRVAERLKDIVSWSEAPSVAIRKGVTVTLMVARPTTGKRRDGLRMDWPDDELMAAVLDHRDAHEDARVVLVSHDVGPKLTASHFGVGSVEIPQKWRIAPDADPLTKENARLRKELLALENLQPRLILRLAGMGDEETHTRLCLGRSPARRGAIDKEEAMERLTKAYPEQSVPEATADDGSPRTVGSFRRQFMLASRGPGECARYNSERLEFFDAYRTYLDELQAYRERPARTLILDFEVRNVGKAPADDVDLCIQFPDGFDLFTEHDLPEEPQKPSPPLGPEAGGVFASSFLRTPLLGLPARSPLPSLEAFSLLRTNSYELTDRYDRIKHGFLVAIRRLFLVFDSVGRVGSFRVSYWMNVGNLPDPESGTIDIEVDK